MNTLPSYFIFALVLLIPASLQAAEYKNPTRKVNAKIHIESAWLRNTQGQNEYVSMTLIARDKKPLYTGQVYRLKKFKATTKRVVDGKYNENNNVIFIDYLIQAGTLRHQTTLQLVNNKPMEFRVIEKTTSTLQAQPRPEHYKAVSYPTVPQLNSPPRLH